MVSNIFNVHPYLGKIPILTSIFFKWVGSTTNQFFTFATSCEKCGLLSASGGGQLFDAATVGPLLSRNLVLFGWCELRNTWAMKKGPLVTGCLGYIRDGLLASFMGIIMNDYIRILIKQPGFFMEKVGGSGASFFDVSTDTIWLAKSIFFKSVTHRIHVWNIYLHLPLKSTKCR